MGSARQPGDRGCRTHFLALSEVCWVVEGWAFKLGSQGLGYYKEGANRHVVSPAAVIPKPVPVTLNLDGLIQHQEQPKQQGVAEILGDPLKATMAEEADKELKATARKLKKQKARSAVGVSSLRCVMAKQVVTKDISHRANGLWAIGSANPNAWAGAEEYLSSTGADVATFQETKVGHEATFDKEATARNMGVDDSPTTMCHRTGRRQLLWCSGGL